MVSVLGKVYREGGVISFWAGVGPNIVRTFLVNAAELGTYDEAKHRLIPYTGDSVFAHTGASGAHIRICNTPAPMCNTTAPLCNPPAPVHVLNATNFVYPTRMPCLCHLDPEAYGLARLAGIAGLASACVSTPADVVKTRVMNAAGSNLGPVNMLLHMLRHEGPRAFYKGFVPIVVRKVLWCFIFFVSYEQIRLTAGAC